MSSREQMLDTYAGRKTRNVYSRTTNPTVKLFEQKIAALERTDDAIGFPSGMAAISGAVLAPFEAWLLLRGLRTLPTRMLAHEASALTLARRLAGHPQVTAVAHPALTGALPPGLMGTSGLFSFTVDASVDIPAFCDALKLFRLGVSWGGHESLVIPSLVTHVQAAGPNSALDFGVPANMIRPQVGLEGTAALWDDLRQGLAS